MRFLLVCFMAGACSSADALPPLDHPSPAVRGGLELARATVPPGLDIDSVEADIADAEAVWTACGLTLDRKVPVLFADVPDGERGEGGPDGIKLVRDGGWATEDAECRGQYLIGYTVRHELGHVFGFGHDDESSSFMYTYALPCDRSYWSQPCSRPVDAPPPSE